MNSHFAYDVFLSHSAKDMAVLRPLAERLRADGLKVWFDDWVLHPGDSIPAKIEAGLEHSRVLCLSAQAFGSDWAQLLLHPPPSTLNQAMPTMIDADMSVHIEEAERLSMLGDPPLGQCLAKLGRTLKKGQAS